MEAAKKAYVLALSLPDGAGYTGAEGSVKFWRQCSDNAELGASLSPKGESFCSRTAILR
jgi:hypothetical protein